MKRKLSLLLAMVLAMTMVMGISVTAFAAPAGTSLDEQNECPTHQGSAGDGVDHVYSFGRSFDHGVDGLCVDCIFYDPTDGPVRLNESMADDWNMPASSFANGEYSEGWYYASESTEWLLYPCVGSAAEAFNSVSIDFNNSNVAGATWDSIKNNITITTDPTDSIAIIQDDSGISEGPEDFIGSTTPLVEGKTYTLWLLLKSTGCEFEAEDALFYPAKNVALQNVEKTSESCSVMTEGHDPAEKGKVLSIKIVFTAKSSSTPGPNPPKPTPKKSESAHVHNFKWQTITAPTKETDGLEGELCSCGAVRNTQPLSAYGYALNEYATPMINAAKSGQTITFEFGEWNSFPKSFMAKLVDKSAQNITFVFHYKWNHVKQEITIPAGTPIDLNFDWYGPAKMAELYGAN